VLFISMIKVKGGEWGRGEEWGPVGAWCWISGDRNAYRLLLYGPWVLTIIYGTIVTTYVLIKLPPKTTSVQENSRETILTLSLYSIVFILVAIGAITNRVRDAIKDNDNNKPLEIWHTFTVSQGALNACVFAYNIRRHKKAQQLNDVLRNDPQNEFRRRHIDDDV